MTTKFTQGKKYTTRSICDHNCIFEIEVISRTAKTIKAKVQNEIKTFRPYIFEDCESIMPFGRYSMCPVISAR